MYNRTHPVALAQIRSEIFETSPASALCSAASCTYWWRTRTTEWESWCWSRTSASSTTASPVQSTCSALLLFSLCFVPAQLLPCLRAGATVVEWLVAKGKARNRPEALMLATGLMNEGFLLPAGDLSKEAAESGEQSTFLDDTNALYYFVSR